jgi:hypothetical protein
MINYQSKSHSSYLNYMARKEVAFKQKLPLFYPIFIEIMNEFYLSLILSLQLVHSF